MPRRTPSLPIPLPPDPVQRRWTAGVVGIVVAVVAVSAFAYGGVEAWTQPLLVLAAALLAIAAARMGRTGRPGLATIAAVAFVALATAQLVPLPLGVLQTLSPARAQSIQETLSLQVSGEAAPAWAPLSYYAPYTRQALASLLVACAVFAAVATTIRSEEGVTWLLTGLFAVGVAQAGLAILQVATDAPGIYWEASQVGSPWTGSFLNHSNFCQFVNAAFGAGLGLLLLRSSTERHRTGRQSRTFNFTSYLQKHGGVLVGLALLAIAMALSLSRGGVIGASVAAAAVTLALARHGRLGPTAWVLLTVPVVAAAGLLAVGADAVYDRIGTLDERGTYADRVELSAATARVGVRHLATGTGLGSHRYVFPAYDTTQSAALAEQADNDYAQLFEEMGAPGVVAVGLFLVSLLVLAERTVRTSRAPVRYALYGVFYTVVAIAVQSVTDFGLRLPAAYLAVAALCGLVPAVAVIAAGEAPILRARPGALAMGAAAAVVAVAGWLGYEAWLDYRGDRWFAIAQATERRLRRDDWAAAPADYIELLTASETASSIRPRDVDYAYWLNAYRWQAFTIGADPTEIVATPEGAEIAERLVAELAAAQRLCPTFGPLYTLEGQVLLATGDPRAFERIAKGRELAPGDPEACYVAGYAACLQESPDRERAETLLQQAVTLDPGLFREAARVWLVTFADETLAEGEGAFPIRLAGEDPERLRQVAQTLGELGGHEATAEELLQRVEQITRDKVAAGEATPAQIAATAERAAAAGRLEEAVSFYRQALARQHANVTWRFALTDVLTKLQRYEEAYREARLCLRLKPAWQPAIQRMEQLSLLAPPDDRLPPLPASPLNDSAVEAAQLSE